MQNDDSIHLRQLNEVWKQKPKVVMPNYYWYPRYDYLIRKHILETATREVTQLIRRQETYGTFIGSIIHKLAY